MILPLAAWCLVTTLHFVLTDRAAARWLRTRDHSLDERVFLSVLGSVTSLAVVLHALTLTVGIGLTSGVVGLAVWHAGLWWGSRPPRGHSTPRSTSIETLALAVFAGILLTWVGLAARSAEILGPDAAHYHVPYAVNFAAGASPFDLPATPHLYPMAGSVVAAWFIVPLGNPLLVDLSIALPFVLLVASLNILFRLTTRLSGLAWASWLGIALFATPMFRMTSLGSADLWFAAACVSLVAAIQLAWSHREWGALDLILIAAAAGLLTGTKATGAPACALILGASAIVAIARRAFAGRWMIWTTGWPAVTAAVIIFIGAGGVWLLRNWIQFGSPLAPAGLTIAGLTIFEGESFQRSTYLSVLAELQTDSFHLWPRTQFYVSEWFGSWFLMLLSPAALLVADAAMSATGKARDDVWWARVSLLIVTIGVGAALVWMLIGAPWTALERSRGLTLRYAVPVAALLPLLAFIGCFPTTPRLAWHRNAGLRLAASAIVIVGASVLLRSSSSPAAQAIRELPVPALDSMWLIAGVALVFLIRAGRGFPRIVRAAAAIGLVAAVTWAAQPIARQDRTARALAAERLRDEADAAAPVDVVGIRWRDVLPAVLAAEHAEGRACRGQRFFSLVRFDEPLALQPPEFGNQVYYAGRDVASARRAGPVGPCDYIISSPAVAATDKGQALADALGGGRPLRAFALTRDLVVYAAGASGLAVRP